MLSDESTDDEEFAEMLAKIRNPKRRPEFVDAAVYEEFDADDTELDKEAKRRRAELDESIRAVDQQERVSAKQAVQQQRDREAIAAIVDSGAWKTTCIGEVVQEKSRRWNNWKERWTRMSRKEQHAYMSRPFYKNGPFTDDHIDAITSAIMELHNVCPNEDASLWTNFMLSVLVPYMLKCIVGLYQPDLTDDEYDAFMRSF